MSLGIKNITLLLSRYLRVYLYTALQYSCLQLGVVFWVFVLCFVPPPPSFPSLLCKVGLRIAAGSAVPILDPAIEN